MTDEPRAGGPRAGDPRAADEVAHERDEDARRHASARLDVVAAVILALATILTTWSAYQSTRWSGIQSDLDSEASAMRLVAAQATSLFAAGVQIDVAMWLTWLDHATAGDEAGAAHVEARFREEFEPAFKAWQGLDGGDVIPPDTPFDLEEYVLEDEATVLALNDQAEEVTAQARRANRTSDDFVLVTVIMAGVLFFAGVGTKFGSPGVRIGMLVMAGLLFAAGLLSTIGLHLRGPAT
ncbi:hypothetical protein BH23CHL8_BH23CHL8_03060 [soil metagenome]